MFSSIKSLGVSGIGGYLVSVEVYISNGLPHFDMVGLPDAAVKEARERVHAAVKNSGFRFPVSRLTVNLAPADKKKTGTVYDLPILVGILAAAGDLPRPAPDTAFIFEQSGRQKTATDDGKWIDCFPEREKKQILDMNPDIAANWDPVYGDRINKLVFIGRGMDKNAIIKALNDCITE